MLRILSLVPFFFFLAACASTGNKIIKCGKNNYVATGSPDHPYGNFYKTARNAALLQANTFCHSKGRQVMVLNIVEGLPSYVTFRCLAEGDPELQQSKYQHVPIPDVTAKTLCN
ncbi:MAG: hypothetical protein OEU48_12685 [Gammaproteobacteria bacterium]|nr:hypothetical protein [Gammaproteobacteria bacterium]